MDGATPAQIFWGVVLPLAAPVLSVVALFSFIATLNEFIIASVLLQTSKHQTLPSGCSTSSRAVRGELGPVRRRRSSGGGAVRILFMGLQKFIVGGLTQGAVKG